MVQKIDMGGFKNEVIEVDFGSDKYEIQLDPPIEVYRQILEMQNRKLKTEKDWNDFKNIIVDLICLNNPDVDREKFFKSLTKISAVKFINAYTDLLFKSSGQKNSNVPLSETESKEEQS